MLFSQISQHVVNYLLCKVAKPLIIHLSQFASILSAAIFAKVKD